VISTVTIESRHKKRTATVARAPARCPLNRLLARVSGHASREGRSEVKGHERRISLGESRGEGRDTDKHRFVERDARAEAGDRSSLDEARPRSDRKRLI